jgi:hypothetical protein
MAYFSQEISANYTRFGGSSAKYEMPTADLGLVTEDIDIFPTVSSPYFSAFVIVWNESADGLRFYVEWDTATDTFRSPVATTNLQNQWVTLVIEGALEVPTDATTMRLYVLAESTTSTPWYLDAALLIQSATVPDAFIEGRSANVLWKRAVRELRRRSEPAVAYELQAKDLTAADPDTYPHDALTIGGNLKIVDRDLAVAETLRLTRIRRNLLTGADVDLDVETFGEL